MVGSPVGQLLAGMEKVEGDLIAAYVRQSGKPIESVVIYGLINDYSADSAEESVLYQGLSKLKITDGLNRILTKLITV